MAGKRALVIVFAKAPIAGAVKTRLIPRVGPELACRLHRAFVDDTIANLDGFEMELHTDRATQEWQTFGRVSKVQTDGDLGKRMLHALESALREGREPVTIVGSDSPTLPSEFISEILASPADVCLGSAEDGGYYAISCRKTTPAMFEDVVWSTPNTRVQTVEAIRRTGLTVALGPEWYDVDGERDLDRLIRDPNVRTATRQVLRSAGLLPSNRLSGHRME